MRRCWPHSTAALVILPGSVAACFSGLRYANFRHRLWLALLLLKTRPAKNRPALCRLEGNCCLRTTLRACRPRFRANSLRSLGALGLALLAVLGVVFELFVVEEDLFARCKNELGSAVDTLEDSIGEFHGRLPSQGVHPKSATALTELAGRGSLFPFVVHFKGARTALKIGGMRTLSRLTRGACNSPRQSRIERFIAFLGFLCGVAATCRMAFSWAHAKQLLRIRSTETGETLQLIMPPRLLSNPLIWGSPAASLPCNESRWNGA
jgi:hypothetical protein